MLDKLKANRFKIFAHFSAVLGACVLAGATATFSGETLGYGSLAGYLYGLVGHKFVAEYLERRMN